MFARIFAALAGAADPPELMIDTTHLKAHRTAASLFQKELFRVASGEPNKGGMNSKLHAVCDGEGRPLLLLTEGQMSDHRGAAMLLPTLPPAREPLADRGYDSNRFRAGLPARGIMPCIPSTKSRKVTLPDDKQLYRQRHRFENVFGRLKNGRRVATRYDRCAHTFFSAFCIAAAVTVWKRQPTHSPACNQGRSRS